MGLDPSRYLVAIGASTGGMEAIKALLAQVPADFPPIAIVQHMPEAFTKSFAERLERFSAMTVSEAVDGDLYARGLFIFCTRDRNADGPPQAESARIAVAADVQPDW